MPSASKDTNIVKIAVQLDDQNAHLMEFDQKRPLKMIISDLCGIWNITDPDQYSLQFNDREVKNYITEKNRNEVKNGSVLRMTFSPGKTAHDILEKLKTSVESRKEILTELVKLSSDSTFAAEFINKQGKDYLAQEIENGAIKQEEGLGLALESFVELMNHSICSWETIEPKFIGKIANQVNCGNSTTFADTKILVYSLAILESIVVSSTKLSSLVEAEVTLPNLISHVQQNTSHPEIQQNSIALINALFHKSDMPKRKAIAATLSSKHIRNVILNSVLNTRNSSGANINPVSSVGSEMAHQLYILQSLLFNLHEEKMHSTASIASETETKEKINEIRRLAFESELIGGMDVTQRSKNMLPSGAVSGSSSGSSSSLTSNYQEDYKRLGFTNHKNPSDDFNEVPPGLLALDLLLYFARNYSDNYVKVVLENCCRSDREHECPIVRSSIQLTKLLCEILKIGDQPSDEGKLFYPMFFTQDHPLEEFFCICVLLLNKTWKEMRATVEDFVKVFSVLRQQLTRSLSDSEAVITFDKFKIKLASLTYSEIMNLWQKERTNREEWESKAQAILELREQIKPQIIELVKEQRLQYLTVGTTFVKYSNKGQRIKDKFWFCKLSNNYKVFYYGDCEENKTPSVDELPHKLAVVDINRIATGRDAPHMKDVKSNKKSTYSLAFSLIPESDQEDGVNFVAPNEKVFDYWTDGINALLGFKMVSKEMEHDLQTLLTMDIKLRLLDTEGVTIPETPPEVPPSPPNYDFHFKY